MNKAFYVGKKNGAIIYAGNNKISHLDCDEHKKYTSYEAATYEDPDFLAFEAKNINDELTSINTRDSFDILDYIRYIEALKIKDDEEPFTSFISEQCKLTKEDPKEVADHYISEYKVEADAMAKKEAIRINNLKQIASMQNNNQ